MEYYIPLPKRVSGRDLIFALEQVAENYQWLYSSEIIAYSVTLLSPASPHYALRPKTLQIGISHKEFFPPDFVGDARGQMTIFVSPNESYLALTVHNVGTETGDIESQGRDLIAQRTLDSFVSSLHDQLRRQ